MRVGRREVGKVRAWTSEFLAGRSRTLWCAVCDVQVECGDGRMRYLSQLAAAYVFLRGLPKSSRAANNIEFNWLNANLVASKIRTPQAHFEAQFAQIPTDEDSQCTDH
jgi:hypothetical protein